MQIGCPDTTFKINRDEEIPDMCITINAIESNLDIPDCMMAEEIGMAMLDDMHLGIQTKH